MGPRYKARGLNDNAEPGNEIECEQIIWKLAPAGRLSETISWSRYTWRRGSVPLWWSVNLKNQGIGEAEIKIRQQNTFKGSRRYRGVLHTCLLCATWHLAQLTHGLT